jgi:hypothetical protein
MQTAGSAILFEYIIFDLGSPGSDSGLCVFHEEFPENSIYREPAYQPSLTQFDWTITWRLGMDESYQGRAPQTMID